MAELHFLGIRRSTIKKIPPFKYYFDFRDFRNYKHLKSSLSPNVSIYPLNNKELKLKFIANQSELKVITRKFPASDVNVFHQVFVEQCYFPLIREIMMYQKSFNNLKIIDAGANVGYASIYFKSFFPSSQIMAIEPDSENIEQITKNFELNDIELSSIIKGGLWVNSKFLEVVRNFRDNRNASFTVREAEHKTEIQGYSFEEILNMANWDEVDLLKIDIEGSERYLFEDIRKADFILQKTKFLAIEIHDEFHIREKIYNHLHRNNFSYFNFGDLTLGINNSKVN